MKMLIKNICLYAADDANTHLAHAAILVNEDKIARIIDCDASDITQIEHSEAVDQIVDGGGMLAMPGLINAHTHLFQTFMRGLGEGLPLYEWLKKMIWPISIAMQPEDFYYAALLGCVEALKGGTTTIVDNHYIHCDPFSADLVIEAMRTSGIRGVLARGYANRYYHPAILEDMDTIKRELMRLLNTWHGICGGRITICPAPLSPVRCTPDLFRWTGDFALENDLMLHTHNAETQTIREETCREYGLSNVRFLKSVNMLHARTNLVHSVKVDEEEMELIRDVGAHVVYCPISNMYLGSGIAPISEFLRKQINVAAASDGPASNNAQNMFETIKVGACLQRAALEDANAVTVEQTIRMATANGGIALGNPNIGTLEEDKQADIILLDLKGAHMRPLHSYGATIAYCAQAADVDTVFVAGKMLVRNKSVLCVDEQALIAECEKRIRSAIERSAYGKQPQ